MSQWQGKPLPAALTPAAAMPWPVVSPFRMRPGLSRLAPADAAAPAPARAPAAPPAARPARPDLALSAVQHAAPTATLPPALFLRDACAADYATAKRHALRAHPPVGRADPAVLQAVAQAYRAQTGVALPPLAEALATGMQEDFVILHDESDLHGTASEAGRAGRAGQRGDGGSEGANDADGGAGGEAGMGAATLRARYLSVCFPSNWAPSEKLGLDFSAIHAPVADNALLQAGARGIVHMAFRQSPMLRHVWLLSPGADLAQHPENRRTRWEDAVAQADACGGRLIDRVFFRVERQTTLPLPALRRGVFFIRVLVCPLVAVLAEDARRAAELADALASMSPAVVAYRGLSAVRDRLCHELSA